jgi:hypothetical protein
MESSKYAQQRLHVATGRQICAEDGTALAVVKPGVGTTRETDAFADALAARWNAVADTLAVLDGPMAGTAAAFATARRILYTAAHGEG